MKCTKCGTESVSKFCENCGNPMGDTDVSSKKIPDGVVKSKKKPIYKRWWFVLIVIIVAISVFAKLGEDKSSTPKKDKESSSTSKSKNDKVKVTVVDFSSMDKATIQSWADKNKVVCKFEQAYSNSIPSGSFVSQKPAIAKVINEGDTISIVLSLGKEPSLEYKSALKKAEIYSTTMSMSKKGIYNQLISEYGEKFPADAAQYAIDNMKADWNANALKKAKTYSTTMSMSKSAVFDQLISEYGEKFTKEEAQYAIDHLND